MKYIKITIIIIITLLLVGCYDYKEINDLTIVSGILLDYQDDKYDITFQIIDENNPTSIKTYNNKCNNIDECIYKLSKVSNKNIFISHLKVLLLTENTIQSKVNYYDYFLRETTSKMNYNVYYVDNKYKDKIINNIDSIYIKDISNINDKMFSSSINLSFLDLIQQKLDYNNTIIYPSLTINDEDTIMLSNLIIFNNDKKIELNESNSIFYNILKNKTKKTIIDIPCDKESFSLVIDKIKTKYNYENKTINIQVNSKSNVNYYNCSYDLDKKETIDKLSSFSNDYIKNNINNIISISKDNNIDFIGLKSYIYKHKKEQLDLKDLNINVEVNNIINSLGEMKNEI